MAKTWSESTTGRYAPSEVSMLLRKLNNPLLPGGKYGILALHGRAAVPGMWAANGLAWGLHSQNLADENYLVLAPDAAGPVTWLNQTSIDAITGAYNALIALGCNTKVGILAHSMGVGAGLVWMKQNPTKVAALYGFAGVSDLDLTRANALFTAEINTAYGGAGTYAANSVGHKIADEYPTWRDLAPIRLAHGTADPFIEPAQSLNFVNGVSTGSNQPQVTYQPIAGADHTSVFAGVTVAETRAFFDAGSWR